ncbi:MAG: hypothetical protein JST38_05150 [Bacteroidetes bacterium]|nr:hypothetical protein [Bacteroidota bacterium]
MRQNVAVLARAYKNAKDPKLQLFYAKLALLEVCGWIEETIDGLVLGHAKHILVITAEYERYRKDVVDKQYGFHYKDNIVPMLVGLFGRTGVSEFESYNNPAKFEMLKSALSSLREARNAHAHTHLKGVTLTVMAPSLLQEYFVRVRDGLNEMELAFRLMRSA